MDLCGRSALPCAEIIKLFSERQSSPKLDVEATCRGEPRLLPSDPDPYPECIREEMEAQAKLEKGWRTFQSRDRDHCLKQTYIGGYPSYVDVLTCVQMAREAD